MSKAPQIIIAAEVIAGLTAAPASAAQIYIGVIPPGHAPVVVRIKLPAKPGLMRFTFAAPKANASVPYAIDFCVGPNSNRCGATDAHVTSVPDGQTKSADYVSAVFVTNVLAVSQGAKVPAPYQIEVK